MSLTSFARRSLLLGLALALSACGDETAAPTTEPLITSFDRMWLTVDREYSYLEYKGIDWMDVRRELRPRAAQARSTGELVDVVREALAALRDVHVWLLTPGGGVEPTFRPSHRQNWSPAMLARQRQRGGWFAESPDVGGTEVDGVPYLVVSSFASGRFTTADFDRLLDRVHDAPALVLDVRMNAGGSDALAYATAGRFAERAYTGGYYRFRNGLRHDAFTPLAARRVVPRGTWQFTRPVVLLTGRGTFSAAEGFVSAMRSLPNVTVVGDTTGGGSGNPAVYPLREGYGIALSRWMEYTHDGEPIEWRGIAPDRAVGFADDALRTGEDETLAYALSVARRLVAAGGPGR